MSYTRPSSIVVSTFVFHPGGPGSIPGLGNFLIKLFLFFLGTVCPWGPFFGGQFVQRDQIVWGPFVQRDQLIGDPLSRGTGRGGPEVRGPNAFGTKCVAANDRNTLYICETFTKNFSEDQAILYDV